LQPLREIKKMNPVFCAIDTKDIMAAEKLVTSLTGKIGGVKLGLEFFMAHGMAGYRAIASKGMPVFLDLKLHDIPNTVAGAVESLLPLKPDFLTIHAAGGPAMITAAANAAAKAGAKRPKILAVTVLTSLDSKDLFAVGQSAEPAQQVLRLAQLAKENGADGVICSPEEIALLRSELGGEFILMVPGIRPAGSSAGDQKRVMTPRQAMDAGATYLVIGRPITEAANPAEAAQRIVAELV
jgi:orotidine-5'-phosphate decarboxylase